MGIIDSFGYTPELLTGLTGAVPNDYGIATSLYLTQLAKEYNMELAKSLGIDVSTPEKYKQFVKTNPDAYKHAFIKHQLGYGLLNSTLGGMIQAHIIKNKLNRLRSMDSSEINENGRFFDMFNEILQAYKTCEDKTSFLAGQVPEEVRPELLAALDAEDETKFNDLMGSVKGSETVDEKTEEAIEPNESEIQIGDQPEVPDTVADADPNTVTPPVENITDTVAAPEGEVATLTEEQAEVVTPTINAVANMTDEIQDLENLDNIPEDLKEGVEIWKDADEDFSIKIIAETVKKMYAGDFSVKKDFSDGEILTTGAEVAKELHDKGEHKTSLTKGIEEVHKDLKVMDLAELYSILGELKNLKDSVINFVNFVAEKDDLGLSPSKKKELADEILNNGLFVDGSDEFRKDVAETLNSAADYSAKDMSTRLSIFKDFSEGFEEHLPKLSDGACECIECVTEAKEEEPEEKPAEGEAEGEKTEKAIEIATEAGTVDKAIEMVEDRIEDLQNDDDVVEGFAELSMDCAVQVAKDNGLDPQLYTNMLYNNSVQRTPYQQKVIDKIMKRNKALNRPFFVKPFQTVFTGAPGSARWDKKYGALDDIGTQVAYTMPNMLGQAGKALDQKYGTDAYGQLGSDLGEWMLANKLDQATMRHFSESNEGDMAAHIAPTALGFIPGLGWIPQGMYIKKQADVYNDNLLRSSGKDPDKMTSAEKKAELKKIEGAYRHPYLKAWASPISPLHGALASNKIERLNRDLELNNPKLQVDPVTSNVMMKGIKSDLGFSCGDKSEVKMDCSNKKDFAEGEAPAEEQISQEVIDNALTNDDQIRALVEKYKMLPTVEAKDQMKADMQTLGFTDEVINMIEQYAEGNFSEGEEAPAEVQAEDVVSEEAPAEETVDVASMVAPELFDSLLGPGVGETDPVDGTLPVGEVEAPGTDLGHLGTLDEGIPSGEPVPEEDKDVTKVEIVSTEGDEFESIMR